MFAILKREINSFFSTRFGFLVVALFLIVNNLILWFIPGEFNVFDNGLADLSSFFIITPWVFLILIPAITMKAFSEEKNIGTFELLATKPHFFKRYCFRKVSWSCKFNLFGFNAHNSVPYYHFKSLRKF